MTVHDEYDEPYFLDSSAVNTVFKIIANRDICGWTKYSGDTAISQLRTASGQTIMHYAVRFLDLKQIENILGQNIDVNKTSYTQFLTPLMIAIDRGDTDIIDLLIRHGANVKLENSKQLNTFAQAAINGDIKVCKYLLGKGFDPTAKTSNRWSPLYAAIALHNDVLFGYFLPYVVPEERDYIAGRISFQGTIGMIKQMQSTGLNINRKDKIGKTMLEAAVEGHNQKVIDYLGGILK